MIYVGKTALHSLVPSRPTRWALENGFLKETVFDWGCGRGRDTVWLNAKNLKTLCYDIAHAPEPKPEDISFSDINTILLNYVLNVIESPIKRQELLRQIFEFGKPDSLIIASVRKRNEIARFAIKQQWEPYNDGYLTSRNTFQKGFENKEFLELLSMLGAIIKVNDSPTFLCAVVRLVK